MPFEAFSPNATRALGRNGHFHVANLHVFEMEEGTMVEAYSRHSRNRPPLYLLLCPSDRRELARCLQAMEGAEQAALDAIASLLDGMEWDADTLDAVAAIVRATGRRVRDVDTEDDDA